MSCLENGVMKVGVELPKGGTVTFLADANHPDVNRINSHDMGRMIQQSYDSGPQPYGNSHSSWPDWPWNPIAAGDCYNNGAEVLSHENDGVTLYVKSIPLQWALDNVPFECTFETWLTLEQNVVHARYRLVNERSDTTVYLARHQELPAVYTPDRFHRLLTYTGGSPYTGGPLTEIENTGPPWAYFDATEKWVALVQTNNWGLGVFYPDAQLFVGGFHGTPGSGDPRGSSCGYMSPLRTETLRHDSVCEYEVRFIQGTLDTIRDHVYGHRLSASRW